MSFDFVWRGGAMASRSGNWPIWLEATHTPTLDARRLRADRARTSRVELAIAL
jgi:hypothetical protein